jgi:hypothetical protein
VLARRGVLGGCLRLLHSDRPNNAAHGTAPHPYPSKRRGYCSLHHTLVSGGVIASFPNSDGVTQATYPSIAAGLRKLLLRAMHGSSEQDGSYTEEEHMEGGVISGNSLPCHVN